MKVSEAKVKRALRKSQQHWRENVTGEAAPSISMNDCALCHLFLIPTTEDKDDCVGCPIYKKTGRSYCKGTPYIRAAKKYHELNSTYSDESSKEVAWRAAALKEYEFLMSLSVKPTTKTKGK